MHGLKSWIFAATFIVAVCGTVAVVETVLSRSAVAQPGGPRDDHWRYHEGRWSFWSEADRRWYYTDGVHWFYHNGAAWAPYHFDKHFGRNGFERGAYRPPAEGVQVTLPSHKIYIGL